MILDTCYAARGGSNTAGPTKGANEVIAATNEVIEAPGVSRLSFTRVLVRVLKNFAEKHRTENLQLSAVWLCTHMRNYYYDQELKKPPYYVSLVNYRFESCRIVPQPHSPNHFLGTLSPLMPPDLGPFCVTAAIYLKDSPSGDVVSWLQGQGAPAGYIDGVELINIRALHLANSSMLLVTMPPAVWLLLPPEIPCTFVGLTRSGNLLTSEKGSATAKIATKKTSSSSIKQILSLNSPALYEEKAVVLSGDEHGLQPRRQHARCEDQASGKLQDKPPPNRYNYNHLASQAFRLIKLRPGQENDCLTGRLITVDPSSAPQYVALSYDWGPPSEERQDPPSILLENTAVVLRPNLASAMRALRNPHKDTHIWIDALCINQADKREKRMQIPFMPDIYRFSDSVAVWLGETTSYSKIAFSFARWIIKHPDLVANVPAQQLRVLITAFCDMLRSRWFQRKWAIADFVLAKEVNLHYGKDVLPWETMAGAVYVFRYKASDLLQLFLHNNDRADSLLDFLADFKYQGVNEFVDLRDDMQGKLSDPLRTNTATALDELVTRTALLKTSEIHDAVYSMIFLLSERRSLSSDVARQSPVLAASQSKTLFGVSAEKTFPGSSAEVPLETTQFSSGAPQLFSPSAFRKDQPLVDYSLSERDVCSNFVGYTILSTRQLDIICRPWAPELTRLPSWVRPISDHAFMVLHDNSYSRVNADCLAVSTSTHKTMYSACGKGVLLDKDQVSVPFSEKSSLIVPGFELGNVDMIARCASNGILPREWRKIGGRIDRGKVSEDWFWRTLVADRDSTGMVCPAWYKLASEHVLQSSDGIDLDTRQLMFESPPGIVFEFLRRVQSVIWGRRLATLDQGYVVLAPGSCEAGDLVTILHGCSVPVLLRRSDKLHCYTVVGECYVHGMMDGEARILEEQGKVHTKSFILY